MFQKQASNILTEEEYLKRLEMIIKRDFYPELYSLEKVRQGHEDEKLTLNEFLSKYTSDENVTLNNIIKREDERWYQKNSWMFEVEEQHRLKQLAIKSNKLENMMDGNRENQLMLHGFNALNPIFFRISKECEKQNEAIEAAKNEDQQLKVERVQMQNTRMDGHEAPLEYAIEKAKDAKVKVQQALNGQGVNVDFFGTTPNLMGLNQHPDMVPLYSPHPNQLGSPLMTWGQIAETPVRIDRSYMIPPSPTRDKLGNKLATNLNIKKRKEQKQQQELLKKRLSSMTPNRIGSSISHHANSELIKNFFQMREGNSHAATPMAKKSVLIQKSIHK